MELIAQYGGLSAVVTFGISCKKLLKYFHKVRPDFYAGLISLLTINFHV